MDPSQLGGPIALFVVMLVLGLELSPEDFRRVAAVPRAVVVGTLAQIVLLPLITWAVVSLLAVPPVFAAGAILVATSPGAGASNVLTALAGANVALSITLTALASVLSVVTLPLLAAFGMRTILGDGVRIDVPVGFLVAQLLASLLLPIGIGMAVRARFPDGSRRHARSLRLAAIGVIVVVVALAIALSDPAQRPDYAGAEAGLLAAGLWTLAAMATGYGVAALLRLPPADRFTFLIEFSSRNVAVAGIMAISGLGRLDLTLFSGAYMAVGFPLCGLAVLSRRRRLAALRTS